MNYSSQYLKVLHWEQFQYNIETSKMIQEKNMDITTFSIITSKLSIISSYAFMQKSLSSESYQLCIVLQDIAHTLFLAIYVKSPNIFSNKLTVHETTSRHSPRSLVPPFHSRGKYHGENFHYKP